MNVKQQSNQPGYRTTALDFCLFSTDTEALLSIRPGISADVALGTVQALCEMAGDLQLKIEQEQTPAQGTEWTMYWWLSIAQAILTSLQQGARPSSVAS